MQAEAGAIGPILSAKAVLEDRLKDALNTAAVLRRKIEAMEQVINILRPNDSELLDLPEPSKQRATTLARSREDVLDRDEVRIHIMTILESSPVPVKMVKIMRILRENGMEPSEYMTRGILAGPEFIKTGERQSTTYTVVNRPVPVGGGK